MDYSRLVESLKKEGTNRICFDCGVVGTTYASLNFGTFVCSQCAGILRGLNFKVKAFGISIFTLDEYEFLQKNGNDKARKVWLGSFNPYKDEKPNPKKYDTVKKHIINKYKLKKYYKESKGIHFINNSIEEDIKDPLDFVNKCRIKNIDIGPSWIKKKNLVNNIEEEFDFSNNNNNRNNNSNSKNNNINQNRNVDLLGGLLEVNDGNNNNMNNNQIKDKEQKMNINDLLEGLNFNNNNINTNANSINNNKNIINNTYIKEETSVKKDNNLGFNFTHFGNNISNNNNNKDEVLPRGQEQKLENDNLGFDFGDERNNKAVNNNSIFDTDKNNINNNIINNNLNNENILDLAFNSSNNKNEKKENKSEDNNFGFSFDSSNNKEKGKNIKSDLGFFSQSEQTNNFNGGIDFFENNNKNNQQNNFGFVFEQQKHNNNAGGVVNDNLGFDFGQQEQKSNNNNNILDSNYNNKLGLDFNFDKKNEEIKEEPKNINSLFEDPNSEKINKMKKIQEMKRSNDYQNLTIALDNQNQMDKINQGNFDFTSIMNK